MNRTIAYLIFIVLISSCSKKHVQVIPTEFKGYVDMFFLEGNQRGLNTDLSDVDLTIKFENLGSRDGACSFQNNTITINEDSWNSMTKEKRIWLIFHELGHCILNRPHKNNKTNNDECLSIMIGTENNFECSLNCYSEKWWNYYLDELFEQNTQFPNWQFLYEDYNSVNSTSNIVDFDTLSDFFTLNSIDFLQYNNFNIDFEFINWNSNQKLVKFYLGNIGFMDCNTCTGTKILISSDNPYEAYFRNSSDNFQFNSNIKLTIRKIDSNLYFYVNERFIHTFESNLWSGNNNITTVQMNHPIQMKLTIDELE